MSLRCFVSSFVDFSPKSGSKHFISTIVSQDFKLINNKLVATGVSTLRVGVGEDYSKNVTIIVGLGDNNNKLNVNIKWDAEWLDWGGTPIRDDQRADAVGCCSLDKAEEGAIKLFQEETREMLGRLLRFKKAELKQVFKI